jgi:hypothetical protein
MKKLAVYLLLLLAAPTLHAQTKSDSLAYQLQRKKINAMLDVRRQKFGQYDQSLSMHTGIFGLQTKKDIRRSNNILMDIVKTDNEIFRQLKILLDYRAFEQTQVQSHSEEIQSSALNYMGTITHLRNQLEVEKKANEQEKIHFEKVERTLFIIIALMFLSILFIISRKRAVNS